MCSFKDLYLRLFVFAHIIEKMFILKLKVEFSVGSKHHKMIIHIKFFGHKISDVLNHKFRPLLMKTSHGIFVKRKTTI